MFFLKDDSSQQKESDSESEYEGEDSRIKFVKIFYEDIVRSYLLNFVEFVVSVYKVLTLDDQTTSSLDDSYQIESSSGYTKEVIVNRVVQITPLDLLFKDDHNESIIYM